MKKTYLLLLLVCYNVMSAHAQFSFEGGLNFSTLNIKANGDKVPTKFLTGASIGMVGGIPISDTRHVFLEIGAFYQTDGAKINTKPSSWNYTLSSMTFPINIEYKSGDKCSKRFFAGAGPYIRDNLSGSAYAIDESGQVGTQLNTLVIGTDIKRIDFGLGINAGYLGKKHWYVRANYAQGLKDNLTNGNEKNYLKQATGGITLGYMFRGCRVHDWSSSRSGAGSHWRGLKKSRWSTRQRLHRANGPAY
jgi:hypothetical protein